MHVDWGVSALVIKRYILSLDYNRNEEEVGVAIRESGIPREEIFVVTKVSPTPSDVYYAMMQWYMP